jgi:short-subunit dehydrogenase
MRDLRGKRVLVTGGARGIGLAIARRFGGEGAEVVVTDLDRDALPAAAEAIAASGAKARTYELDVTDGAAILALKDRLHADAGPVDVLVNNAGVVFGGAFLDVPLERHFTTYRINVLGLTAVTHAFLPDLISRPDAHLVNVASASGFISLPYGTTYASSKWAVVGLSDSIRVELELQGHGHVHVTTVCPSYVSTGLFDGVKPPLLTSMLTPDNVADLTLRAVKKNKPFVLTPWLVKLAPPLKGSTPTPISDRVFWLLGVTKSMLHWRGRA